MKKVEEILNNKKIKYSLFFGFYLIFFLVLALSFKNVRQEEINKVTEESEESIEAHLPYLDNELQIEIEVHDEEKVLKYNANDSDYSYAKLFNLYNINQLIKKSKIIKKEDKSITYEISIEALNNLLAKENTNSINEMIVTDFGNKTYMIEMDLHEYLEKENYQIIINYKVGVRSEQNSIS